MTEVSPRGQPSILGQLALALLGLAVLAAVIGGAVGLLMGRAIQAPSPQVVAITRAVESMELPHGAQFIGAELAPDYSESTYGTAYYAVYVAVDRSLGEAERQEIGLYLHRNYPLREPPEWRLKIAFQHQ